MKNRHQPKLADKEWAFHKVPENERYACLWHERSRGVGKGRILYWNQKPWLKLRAKERKFLMSLIPPADYRRPSVWRDEQPQSGIDRISTELQRYAIRLAKERDPQWKPPIEEGSLKLDWRICDTKLERDFKEFIRRERRTLSSAGAQYAKVARSSETGRKRDEGRSLIDIAIVRATAAGFNRLGVVTLLEPLLTAFGFKTSVVNGLYSAKNFSTTLREAKEKLKP